MSDFLSINPAPDTTVTINGKRVPVYGISMAGLGLLIPRYPNLVADLTERMQKDGFSLNAIIEVAGPAIGSILAAGLGFPGNEDAETKAAQLDISTQLKLLEKIVEKTMPDGLGPFVEAWSNLMARFTPPAPRKMRFKVLQRTSNASSESTDTASMKSGT